MTLKSQLSAGPLKGRLGALNLSYALDLSLVLTEFGSNKLTHSHTQKYFHV